MLILLISPLCAMGSHFECSQQEFEANFFSFGTKIHCFYGTMKRAICIENISTFSKTKQ